MTWYEKLWFVSGFTAIVVTFALKVLYHRRLRTRHRETWLDLGSPRLFQGSTRRREQHRILWNREHRRLSDPVLDRLAAAIRISAVGFLTILAAELVLLYFVGDPPSVETTARPPAQPAADGFGPIEAPQLAFLAALLSLTAISWTVLWRFLRRLRRCHPETWRELGYPTSFLNANGWSMFRFLWLLRFRALRDPRLDRPGMALLIVYLLLVLVLVAGLVVY